MSPSLVAERDGVKTLQLGQTSPTGRQKGETDQR